MRIASWTNLALNGIVSITFSVLSLLNNWNDGQWSLNETLNILEMIASGFGIVTAIFYAGTVNAYSPYL